MRRVLVAVLVLVAACGGGDDEAGTTTTSSSTTTSTTVAAGAGWTRPCEARDGGPSGVDHGTRRFGPLGDEPSIVVEVPSVAGADEYDRVPGVRAGRVEGGTAVLVGSRLVGAGPPSILAVVDDDGSLRWARCLPASGTDLWSSPVPGARIVVTGLVGTPWSAFDPVDGSPVDAAVLEGARGASWAHDGQPAFLLRFGDEVTLESLSRYDLVTGELARLGSPGPEAGDRCLQEPELVDGTPVLAGAGVWVDGRWRTDAASIDRVVPLRATGTCEGDGGMHVVGATGSGRVRWDRPDLEHPGLEGQWLVQDATTAVVWSCGGPRVEGQCPLRLDALDVATGTTRWQLDGSHGLELAGDGYVVTVDEGGTAVRDILTGEPVQRVPDRQAFMTGCCGEGETRHTHRVGGVVLSVLDDELRIWFAREESGPTRRILLPSG